VPITATAIVADGLSDSGNDPGYISGKSVFRKIWKPDQTSLIKNEIIAGFEYTGVILCIFIITIILFLLVIIKYSNLYYFLLKNTTNNYH